MICKLSLWKCNGSMEKKRLSFLLIIIVSHKYWNSTIHQWLHGKSGLSHICKIYLLLFIHCSVDLKWNHSFYSVLTFGGMINVSMHTVHTACPSEVLLKIQCSVLPIQPEKFKGQTLLYFSFTCNVTAQQYTNVWMRTMIFGWT